MDLSNIQNKEQNEGRVKNLKIFFLTSKEKNKERIIYIYLVKESPRFTYLLTIINNFLLLEIIVFFMGFWMAYFVTNKYQLLTDQDFKQLDPRKQADIISRIVAMIHATIASVLGYLILFHSCNEPGKTMINDDFCLMNPSKFLTFASVLSAGYLLYDILVCFLLVKDKSALMKQTYLHHCLGLIGVLGSMYAGKWNISISSVSMITEISTIFLNFRTILILQKKGDTVLFKINLFLFVILFIISRILFYPVTIYRIYCGFLILDYESYERSKLIVSIVLSALYCLLFFLQLIWFQKILQTMVKTFSGKYNTNKPKTN